MRYCEKYIEKNNPQTRKEVYDMHHMTLSSRYFKTGKNEVKTCNES
ncbi:hypothetical protein DDI_1418 [Dickeya dianthicola RNS04.9]|nr:hypothetical protein DDI_1418 [Dickeya dianthicola RNS04.9]